MTVPFVLREPQGLGYHSGFCRLDFLKQCFSRSPDITLSSLYKPYGLQFMKQVIGELFPEVSKISFTDSRVY